MLIRLLPAALLSFLLLCSTVNASEDMPFNEDSWLMVVLPDIQSYVDHTEHMEVLESVVDWIAENAEQHRIALVLQEGDIVFQNNVWFAAQSTGNQNSLQQWGNARSAMLRLAEVVPVVMATGNHDYGRYNAENRSSQFGKFFPVTDFPLLDPGQGGILHEMYPNAKGKLTMENATYDFTAPDGRRMLLLSLEWGPRAEVVQWADELCGRPEFSGHTKVLLTHAFMYHDDTRYNWAEKGRNQAANPYDYPGTAGNTSDGEDLWNGLARKHPLMQLVFSGHVGGDMVGNLTSTNDAGNQCHQMLFNAQFLKLGGEGWIRLLEFMPDGTTVKVRTFSPWFQSDGDPSTGAWRRGIDDEFSLQLLPSS